MKKLPLLLGICLIAAAVCLMAALQLRMHLRTEQARETYAALRELLPEPVSGAAEEYPDAKMPVLAMDGVDYAGLLEVPAFGVRVPIADQWKGDMVGRFWGSAYDGTLIVGGPDYPGQFDFCDKIDIGTKITVTDMTGASFDYYVTRVDRAGHADPAWLVHGDSSLTLFCHDLYAMEYLAVRCK